MGAFGGEKERGEMNGQISSVLDLCSYKEVYLNVR